MPMKPKIKILLADDHQVVRMGLAAIIAAEADMLLIGEASDGAEAVNPDTPLAATVTSFVSRSLPFFPITVAR